MVLRPLGKFSTLAVIAASKSPRSIAEETKAMRATFPFGTAYRLTLVLAAA
jgi:hypothetical protein